MKAVFARIGALALAAALTGCANSGSSPSEVTRFHLNQPIARGQIAVEAFTTGDPASPEFRTYAEAVERQLARLGWTVVTTVGQSEQVALVGVDRRRSEGRPQRSPVSVGVGGGTGGYGSGVGVGLGVNLGGSKSGRIEATMLQVRIKRRSDGTVFWEGRAETQARPDRPEGQPAAVADRLAEALFLDFPGESGRSITVE